MTRGRKWLAWIVGIVVALVLVIVLAIALFDWNRLRPYINAKASQALGRPFAINGDLSVAWRRDAQAGGWRAWLPLPEFTARDVTIANPAWAGPKPFAHLDGVRMRLALLPLLIQHVDIPSVQLMQPQVDLERDAQGRATWNFTPPQDNAPSAWTLKLGSLGFDRGHVIYDDAVDKIALDIRVELMQRAIPYDQIVAQTAQEAHAQARATAGSPAVAQEAGAADADTTTQAPDTRDLAYQFAWTAQGSYHGAPAGGSGRIGAVLALQQRGQPFPLAARVHVGDTHIGLAGTLTDPLHLAGLDLRLWFAGPTMADLYPILGVTLPDTPPYATEGHLVATLGRNGSTFSYRHFRGHVGGSDLSGTLDYASGGPRPKLNGDVHSTLLQFTDLAPLVGADTASQKTSSGDTTAQPAGKVLPVMPFRTNRWHAMDADVNFSADRIVHGADLPISSLATHLVMDAGVLSLQPLNFGVAGGSVRSDIRLDGSRTPMAGLLDLKVRQLGLKQLFPQFSAMQSSFGQINGDAKLAMRGNSVAALLGSANGELKLLMNDGAISKTLLETAGLNVGNVILAKLFGDRTVKINCAASDLVADDGVFDARLFVFDTQDAVIDISGTANMKTEALDLDVVPHTKGLRILSLRSPLYVRGTLKHPDVGVQAGPLALRAGAALALGAVAAPVAALLALTSPSRDTGNDNTCRAVLEQMRTPPKLSSSAASKTASRAAQAAGVTHP